MVMPELSQNLIEPPTARLEITNAIAVHKPGSELRVDDWRRTKTPGNWGHRHGEAITC